MTKDTLTYIHLRGDDARLTARHTEITNASVLAIYATNKSGEAILETPLVELFWHHEDNGFTEAAIMDTTDRLIEAAVALRHEALKRLMARRAEATAKAEQRTDPDEPERDFADPLRVLTQDECDALGLDNREQFWRMRDLSVDQTARLMAARTHSLIQR